jgi:hypothetical protein
LLRLGARIFILSSQQPRCDNVRDPEAEKTMMQPIHVNINT